MKKAFVLSAEVSSATAVTVNWFEEVESCATHCLAH